MSTQTMTHTQRLPAFINVVDAAKLAGYSTRHFRRLAEEEHLKFIQIGRKLWLLRVELEAWIASYQAQPQ